MDLLSMATRFRVNGFDIEKGRTGWWIFDRGMVYNHRTEEWTTSPSTSSKETPRSPPPRRFPPPSRPRIRPPGTGNRTPGVDDIKNADALRHNEGPALASGAASFAGGLPVAQ
ncbi:MAG: hypothetical protein J2P17_31215, partial [Mycobacterium sp.]|nr:hypothetical protein [Mycobacterium sp.]